MTYTIRNARMTLGSAMDVINRPEAGWSADQLARAKAVAAHWARIRRNQAKRKATP
jgi:hypothetical protein